MPFPWLPPCSYLAAPGTAGLRSDPWSDVLRRKSLSRTARDYTEPPLCTVHGFSAPPNFEDWVACLGPAGQSPQTPGRGREAANTSEAVPAGFTGGQCDGIKIAPACGQSLSTAAVTAVQPPVSNSGLQACFSH